MVKIVMSLRKQLNDILISILPANPAKSIKGTELIRLVRMQLDGNYSDASLRYHYSIMSCDPSSPIAKVEKGQGYYRRSVSVPALSGAQELLSMTQGRLDDIAGDHSVIDVAMLRIRKFRAIVNRYYEINGRFPFVFREAFAQDAPLGNLWKYPEMIFVDWETDDVPDQEMALDPTMLSLKQRLGLSPFRLQAARLRIQPSLQTYREDFFQTLAISQWAQAGELIYAAPITDEALADGLRRLNSQHGVGVISFGLTSEMLDDLPRPAEILNALPREIEAIISRLDINRIAATKMRQHLDWHGLNELRSQSSEVRKVLSWLNHCVQNAKAEPYKEKNSDHSQLS
jgi:hypothetical protein